MPVFIEREVTVVYMDPPTQREFNVSKHTKKPFSHFNIFPKENSVFTSYNLYSAKFQMSSIVEKLEV